MPFQFLCPQGHLLQAEPAHMGMSCQCPHCGITFLIPHVELPGAQPEPEEAEDPMDFEPPQSAPPLKDFLSDLEVKDEKPAETRPQMVHIPCPNGHVLETPFNMVGEEVLCPFCAVQFRLRSHDSLEHKREVERRESEQGRVWMHWAITISVIVAIGLIALIFVARQR